MKDSENLDIQKVDELNAQEYTPVIVTMACVLTIGLIGNIFSSIFYIRKAQKSVINFLISSLSINDAITNAVMVQEIVQLFYYLSEKNIIVCKTFDVLKHWLVGNSLLFMVAVAADRYRRVCFPFSKQMTYAVARYVILGLTVFSGLISVRSFITTDVYTFNITANSNSTIPGYYCTQSKRQDLKQLSTIFHIVDICIHALIMLSFITLNILLIRKILQTKRKLDQHGPSISFKRMKSINETSADCSSTDVVHIDFDHTNDVLDNAEEPTEKKTIVREKPEPTSRPKERSKSISDTLKSGGGTLRRMLSNMHASQTEIRITVMIVVITIISALCFVPYYVAIITVKQDFGGSIRIMSAIEILVRRSYILNSAVNPPIMVFFNLPFRQFVMSMFCRCCLRYKTV